jgi:hypothetical protein
VASALREFLQGKTADAALWPGNWYQNAADMLRIDLDVAGVPYEVQGVDGPLFADFHGLRHSYIALLEKSGATLTEAMQLARHSDLKLTMAVYGRTQLHDLGRAVEKLPQFFPDASGTAEEALRATGVGGEAGSEAIDCTSLARNPDSGEDSLRLLESQAAVEGENTAGRNSLQNQGVAASCEPVIAIE